MRALGYNTLEFDQSVQVYLAQFSEFVLNGKLADANKDLLMELLGVVRVNLLHDIASDSV